MDAKETELRELIDDLIEAAMRLDGLGFTAERHTVSLAITEMQKYLDLLKQMEGKVLMPENPTPEWVRWYRNETGCGLPKAIKDYKAMITAKEE